MGWPSLKELLCCPFDEANSGLQLKIGGLGKEQLWVPIFIYAHSSEFFITHYKQ